MNGRVTTTASQSEFVAGYMREFPGAKFERVRRAAALAGHELARVDFLRIADARHSTKNLEQSDGLEPRKRYSRSIETETFTSQILADIQRIIDERDKARKALQAIADIVNSCLIERAADR